MGAHWPPSTPKGLWLVHCIFTWHAQSRDALDGPLLIHGTAQDDRSRNSIWQLASFQHYYPLERNLYPVSVVSPLPLVPPASGTGGRLNTPFSEVIATLAVFITFVSIFFSESDMTSNATDSLNQLHRFLLSSSTWGLCRSCSLLQTPMPNTFCWRSPISQKRVLNAGSSCLKEN